MKILSIILSFTSMYLKYHVLYTVWNFTRKSQEGNVRIRPPRPVFPHGMSYLDMITLRVIPSLCLEGT